MAKQEKPLTVDEIRGLIQYNDKIKQANLATMRSLADENDVIDRRNKRLQKQLNDLVYPPIK